MKPFRIETSFDEETGRHFAVAPELSFCTGIGATPEEARARLMLAISRWFDADGKPLRGPECACGEPS